MNTYPGNGSRNPIEAVANWWQNWRAKRENLAELERCGPEEVERIANDSGITGGELRALAGKWPDAADLLTRRLDALHLDAVELAHTEPHVLCDLQRVCSLCAAKGRCAHDFAVHPPSPAWHDYCPNASTLDALAAEREGARAR